MDDIPRIRTIYRFVTAYHKNPRISVRELHRNYSHYKQRRSTSDLLKTAIEKSMIVGPRIWCNSGLDVEIHRDLEDPLMFFDTNRKRAEITYMTAAFGDLSIFCLKKGASVLQYAETILPSYPGKKTLDQITLEKKGKIIDDQYPHGWDKLDWDVYELMKTPFKSFYKVGRALDVSWQTVQDRFNKIVKNCKTWVLFLPKGYDNYHQAYLMFKTEYETNLREELQKLDRTTIIYKFEDTILLHVFLDEILLKSHHYYRHFFELKREGTIHDLHVSVPIEWHSPYW